MQILQHTVDAHRHPLPDEVVVLGGSCAALLEEWADKEGGSGRDTGVADRNGFLDALSIGVVEVAFEQGGAVASGLSQVVFGIPEVDIGEGYPYLSFTTATLGASKIRSARIAGSSAATSATI